ncbi:ABC transporter permease [Streptomyces sp. NBC_01304]|uniref:ABC transporter permease n=1 Tax=Streptomyces sp. NBC_01304 TaxID=2903818 RepID=UPI002E0F25E8|nr:ABC transporter permease [Streptomyces sp. NBC_01304]
MLRTALRNVLAHKARLIMTALAVMLGVAFVAGTLVFGDTVTNSFRNASAKSLDGVAVSVQAQDGPTDGAPRQQDDEKRSTALDDKLTDKIGQLPGVESVRPTVNGRATLADKDGRPVNADNSWQNLATNYVPGKDGKDPHYPLKTGRGPASADEIVLDAKTAEKAGYKTGDTVRFAIDGPAFTKKLVGTVDTDDPRVTAGGSLALFDTKTAQKLYLRPGQYDELVVRATPGTDDQALTNAVQAVLPKDKATATSGAQLAAQQSQQIADSTKALTKMLLVFAGITLFVGIFIIANTFTMLIAQRTREIALMRAVGASRRQVVRSVLIEAALLGLGASAAGFALGLGIASLLPALLNAGGAGLPDGPLVIGPGAVIASLAVGVVVTVLSAWLPSRKAAKVAPVEAMSSVDLATPPRGLIIRNIIGTLIGGLGVLVMLYISTLKDGSESNLMIAMLGSGLTLVGVIILAPLLSRPLVQLAGKATTRLFGASGKLAKENALRNPRRTAATASALMIGLTLITGITVAGVSTQEAAAKSSTQGMSADYRIDNTSYSGLSSDSAEKLGEVPGVVASNPMTSAPVDVNGTFAVMTGSDPAQLGKVTDLKFTGGSLDDVGPGRIAVSDEYAKKHGVGVGDTLDAKYTFGDEKAKGTHKLRVVGVYEANPTVNELLGATSDVQPYSYTPKKIDSILVKAEPGKAAGLEQDLRDALGNSPLLKVQNKDQLVKAEAGTIDLMLNMIYGLLGMAVVIAVLGVINTLAMSVFERTREIGMLRAIGLDRAGIKQMVRLESVVISLFGAVLGIGTGIFLAWAGGSLAAGSMKSYEMVLPWGRLGLFLLLALVIGVLAAIWPARRAARLNMLESIQAA